MPPLVEPVETIQASGERAGPRLLTSGAPPVEPVETIGTAREASMGMADAERFQPATLADWHDWLAANHHRGAGVWVVTWRPSSGEPQLSYDELIHEALCWGWVDGQASPLDERRSMLWFTKRKPNSPWAATNKARVADLERAGRLQPAGIAEIERAKANGMWTC